MKRFELNNNQAIPCSMQGDWVVPGVFGYR